MTRLKRNGEIYTKNNEIIGHIQWDNNTLVNIWIDEEYRCNGHATEAVRQMISYIEEENYNFISTTIVLNNTMETVLEKNGFKPNLDKDIITKSDINTHADITQDTILFKDENRWIKIL
jgi:RimJ/RimL family protein N-acetyltransferase